MVVPRYGHYSKYGHFALTQGRAYHRSIPAIAHQRLAPVSSPPAYVNARLSMYDELEPAYQPTYSRYQPSSYLDDAFSTTLEVTQLRAKHQNRLESQK